MIANVVALDNGAVDDGITTWVGDDGFGVDKPVVKASVCICWLVLVGTWIAVVIPVDGVAAVGFDGVVVAAECAAVVSGVLEVVCGGAAVNAAGGPLVGPTVDVVAAGVGVVVAGVVFVVTGCDCVAIECAMVPG